MPIRGMLNLTACVVMVGFSLLFSACSEKSTEFAAPQSAKAPEKQLHSGSAGQAGSAESVVIEAIKKQTFPEFPAMTIGKALDGYIHFTAHEWQGVRTDRGKYYIDCIGWLDTKTMDVANLKNGVARQGIGLKFVVLQDNTFSLEMVSRLEARTDGNVYLYPIGDAKGILGKIYGNKEIRF